MYVFVTSMHLSWIKFCTRCCFAYRWVCVTNKLNSTGLLFHLEIWQYVQLRVSVDAGHIYLKANMRLTIWFTNVNFKFNLSGCALVWKILYLINDWQMSSLKFRFWKVTLVLYFYWLPKYVKTSKKTDLVDCP